MIKSFTWLLGIILLVIGILGFVSNPVLGLFEVDTMHNIIHIVTGVVGIAAAASGVSYARLFLIVFGMLYAVVAVLGFAMNGDILGIITTNRAEDYLYTALALVSLAIGFGGKK